jgi:NifB/MoaA-like Fe-S oxidoreductase
MITSMKEEFEYALECAEGVEAHYTVSVATGYAAYDFIRSLADKAEKAVNGLKVNVYKVRNDFFGEHITVAGLLTGKDLVAQLRGKELGQKLLLPSVMFRADENITLDDMTQLDIENALGIKTEISESTGDAFFDALTNI